MNKAKIDKYVEYGITKIKMLYKEKTFRSNGYRLKYMLEQGDSDDLIVILSGLPRPGLKARYNYGRTLSGIKANKLFILDDFGYDKRGAYYLGKDNDFKIQLAVKDLISKIKKDLKTNRTIYIGSSKGGYAAMYFGVQDNKSIIIAGSLQYKLSDYITISERLNENTMKYIVGNKYTEKDYKYLNDLLKNVIIENKNNQYELHLHYSDKEYTYGDHMVHLLKDLDELGIRYTTDVAHYENHDELAYYFPPFLVDRLNKTLS